MRALICGAVLGALVFSACTDDGSDDVDGAAESDAAAPADDGSLFSASSTTAPPMRPVPTLTPDGEPEASELVDADGDGVVSSPTLVPDPNAPATPADTAPPSTELVGDPQPEPAATTPTPPVTVAPPPPACDRLAALGVDDELAGVVAPVDSAEPVLDDTGCRYRAGGVIVDVWFVPLGDLDDDWYGRPGIEPVADAGGAAVGLVGFEGHDGTTGAGYTVATTGRTEGVIVSVGDTAAARTAAGSIASLAAQAG